MAKGPSPRSYPRLGADGVTPIGGAHYYGTIFEMDPANGNATTLYNFGNDAVAPDGSLIMWKDALYGTTRRGGKSGKDLGTIFRYAPATNTFDELYAFGGKPDGAHPRGGLVFLNVDRKINFGTTTTVVRKASEPSSP